MSTHPITIHLPDGSAISIERSANDVDQTLSDFLEAKGYGLNTRCGGRGLCRGCQVSCKDSETTRTLRSCQTTIDALPDAPVDLEVPHSSWHDHTLYGVSCFDIRIEVPAIQPDRSGLELAIDIGTTTLAGALWDLSTGQCLADASIANPQRKYGDNVLSRISYSIDRANGLQKLQRALVDDGLAKLIQILCLQANIPITSIQQATIAGNPIMLHTLIGASLVGLSTYPFEPEFLGQRTIQSESIGLNPCIPIKLLPALGPFVGADVTAGALASGMLAAAGPTLLIDFGTNGEIILKHEGGTFATATAAGPAFEGGRLSCGASARAGVVSSFEYNDARWDYQLCAGESDRVKGISGAAYIDFLALGLESELLNLFGRFDVNHPDVSEHTVDGDSERIVRFNDHLWISEPDVAEILQAKAAISAGVRVLLELAGVEASNLQTVFVAGGFGYHLNPAHAIAIGLLPDVPVERIDTIGNASLGGTSLLVQADYSEAIEALCNSCKIVELNQVPSFSDHYTDSLLLEEIE